MNFNFESDTQAELDTTETCITPTTHPEAASSSANVGAASRARTKRASSSSEENPKKRLKKTTKGNAKQEDDEKNNIKQQKLLTRQSGQVIAKIAPMLSQLEHCVHTRLTTTIKPLVQEWIIKQGQDAITQLKKLQAQWVRFQQGHFEGKWTSVTFCEAMAHIKSLNAVVKNVSGSLDIAESTVSK